MALHLTSDGRQLPTPAKIAKRFFSWEQIHATVLGSVDQLAREFDPTLLVGISGGGLIPLRMLRSGFKLKAGRTIPVQVVGAIHYDDDHGQVLQAVQRTQWMSTDVDLSGARVLLIDEVDDSRKTLAFIVDEMLRFFDEARAAHEASGKGPWVQPQLGTYVIHNKVRPKEATISSAVFPARYWAGQDVPNMWNVYPWDAADIISHTALAHAQEHYFREKPGELALALAACKSLEPEDARSANTHYADGGNTVAPPLVALVAQPVAAADGAQNGAAAGRPRSALTTALSGTAPVVPTSAAAAQQTPVPQPAMPKVASGVWRAEPDGMYYNMGLVPQGLAPRFGSLTLVEYGMLAAGMEQNH